MPDIRSDHLPDVYLGFRERFPDIAAGQGALAGAVDAAGPLDAKTKRLVKLGIAVGAQADGAVRSNVRKALAAGASVAEIEPYPLPDPVNEATPLAFATACSAP